MVSAAPSVISESSHYSRKTHAPGRERIILHLLTIWLHLIFLYDIDFKKTDILEQNRLTLSKGSGKEIMLILDCSEVLVNLSEDAARIAAAAMAEGRQSTKFIAALRQTKQISGFYVKD